MDTLPSHKNSRIKVEVNHRRWHFEFMLSTRRRSDPLCDQRSGPKNNLYPCVYVDEIINPRTADNRADQIEADDKTGDQLLSSWHPSWALIKLH